MLVLFISSLVLGSLTAGAQESAPPEKLQDESGPSQAAVINQDGLHLLCSTLISLQVEESGTFNAGVGTDGLCQPTAAAWDLMYRWPGYPGTSYTTARIDGNDLRLGTDVLPIDVSTTESSVSHLYEVAGVRILQTLTLDHAFTIEGDENTILISYQVLNIDSVDHDVDLRVMIDTELNYNDGAPFQVPGIGAVTTERDFVGLTPEFVIAFEDFADQEHISAAEFATRRPGAVAPSRLVIGTWPGLYGSSFDYTVDPSQEITRDSAFAVYFEPPLGILRPAESMRAEFRYGRSDVTSDLLPPLGLSVAAQAEVAAGETFPVTSFVTNLGGEDAIDVIANIALPAGLVASDPDRDLGDIAPGETVQVTWEVSVGSNVPTRPVDYSVGVAALDVAPKAVTRTINVTAGSGAFSGPLPAVFAHGITGVASEMDGIRDRTVVLVPGLDQSETQLSPTGEIDSVWENAETLIDSAEDLVASTGAPSVEVVAHSKGGLDTRAAMARRPDLFTDLGMLGTPNGGSILANIVCAGQRVDDFDPDIVDFWRLLPHGPCDSESDGLYNLQTWWVQDVFNAEVDRSARHDFYNVAGDCIGFPFADETQLNCNVKNVLLGCSDVDGDGDADGDGTVCVESSFWETPEFNGGRHQAVYPLMFDIGHGQLREFSCPTAGAVTRLYPKQLDTSVLEEMCPTFSTAATHSATPSDAGEDMDDLGGFVTTDLQTVVTNDSGTVEVPVTMEGTPRLNASVFSTASQPSSITYRTATRQHDPTEMQMGDVFGASATSYIFDTGSQDGVLVIEATPDTAFGLVLEIESDITTEASVTGLGDDALVEFTIIGASPSLLNEENVEARIGGSSPSVVTLEPTSSGSDRLVYSAVVSIDDGGSVPIDVQATGPIDRLDFTGFVRPDNSATLDGVVGQRVVDVDGDGTDDALEYDIAVTTSAAGEYHLSFDLTASGADPAGGLASATLGAGAGVMSVRVDLAELAAVAASGQLQVSDVLLTRGDTHRWVARADSLGFLDAIPLDALGAGELRLARPEASMSDSDNDGFFDTLTWSWTTWVPETTDYAMTGVLVGPNGQLIERVEGVVAVEEGVTTLSHDFDGSVVGATGSGRYVLADLSLTSMSDPAITGTAPDGVTDVLRDSEWIGGTANIQTLIRFWDNAENAGKIPNHGLYTSQRNRLTRVDRNVTEGNLDVARRELERFHNDVSAATSAMIDPTTAERIASYAGALIQVLE